MGQPDAEAESAAGIGTQSHARAVFRGVCRRDPAWRRDPRGAGVGTRPEVGRAGARKAGDGGGWRFLEFGRGDEEGG